MSSELAIKPDEVTLTLEGKFALTRAGLVVVGPIRPSLDEYGACYAKLCVMQDATQLWIGDFYNAVQADFGEDAAQLFDEYDYTHRSITNFARVARSIPIERRRAELAYAHHESVASLSAREQDELLDEAVKERLTVQQLRRRVREMRGEAPLPPLGQTLMQLTESWRAAPAKRHRNVQKNWKR